MLDARSWWLDAGSATELAANLTMIFHSWAGGQRAHSWYRTSKRPLEPSRRQGYAWQASGLQKPANPGTCGGTRAPDSARWAALQVFLVRWRVGTGSVSDCRPLSGLGGCWPYPRLHSPKIR